MPSIETGGEVCRLCRIEHAGLSFEHTPPRGAFNDESITVYSLGEWLHFSETGELQGGQIEQRGAGAKVLCEQCNNKTGSWYGTELQRAARTGARFLREAPLDEFDMRLEPTWASIRITKSETGPHPLHIIKQMVTMMLATSQPEFSLANSDLGDFVLDREATGLSDRYRFYLSLFAGPNARQSGVATRLRIDPPRVDTIVEVAFPPFAYVMTIDSDPEAIESADITSFADVGYNQRADVEFDLLVGFGHTIYPADYRTKAMVEAESAASEDEDTDGPLADGAI